MVELPPLPPGEVPDYAEKVNINRNNRRKKGNHKKPHDRSKSANDVKQKEKPKPLNKETADSNNEFHKEKEETEEDDGWEHFFDQNTGRYFFFNSITKRRQWKNPRVSDDHEFNQGLPNTEPPTPQTLSKEEREYEEKLQQLKNDEEFEKLSTFEKYKRVQKLKEELSNEARNANENLDRTSVLLVNSKETNSLSKKSNNRVDKRQAQSYKNKKNLKRENKLRQWSMND
ncbi:hypothetical protein WICMUC_003032 [Wickerhamomyces mucosus]|uniref:WW domain-containing protein n=1 Tax=Wickerhamomyces mucosus TaxID=1378264 RepID=A0A9P8PNW7_9ASCO|nr:hypothetical protein WICMUC_003032 [Wickerhamomyces mucosus]